MIKHIRKKLADLIPWLCFGLVLFIQQQQLTYRGKWMACKDDWQKQVNAKLDELSKAVEDIHAHQPEAGQQ